VLTHPRKTPLRAAPWRAMHFLPLASGKNQTTSSFFFFALRERE
jgi:hypothetical protein